MKKLIRILQEPEMHWVGNGFPVRTMFDYNRFGRELSPFLLLDYAAPYPFEPSEERRGVGEHPHRGFETVTIAYQGEIEHRDSSGGGGKIHEGDVQWMTAGSGIVHDEFQSHEFTRKGGMLQMAQLWVNLRAKDKKTKPRYQSLVKADIPNVSLPNGAGNIRIIAGEYEGHKGAAKTFSPVSLWDLGLRHGNSIELPLSEGHTTALLVLSGDVTINNERNAGAGSLAIFERAGAGIALKAKTDAKLLIMGGQPIEESIVGQGPFVMNTPDEIRQAIADYQNGRMGRLPD
jgi:redox-sensitive bicupin YhaK (pirin superfamily)